MKDWTLVLVGMNLALAAGALLFWPTDNASEAEPSTREATPAEVIANTNRLPSTVGEPPE